VSAALWHSHVAAIVSDNLAIAVIPPDSEDDLLYFRAIALLGMTFRELFDMEDLADDCARDGRYEFLMLAIPHMLRGGVGFPRQRNGDQVITLWTVAMAAESIRSVVTITEHGHVLALRAAFDRVSSKLHCTVAPVD
jgi:hypothetical protein